MSGMSGAGATGPFALESYAAANGELRTHIKVSDQTILA